MIDASRSEGAQAAVEYHSKISLHFGKDFAIFCEGEWRQHVNNNNVNTNRIFCNKDVSHRVNVLVLKSVLILIFEGAQVAPATLQTFADGDQSAPQTDVSKLIVIYCNSKISLHFRKDGKILC
jgi:hypothetical protein